MSHSDARAIAIIPSFRRVYLNFLVEFQLRSSPQRLAQDLRLEAELSGIVDVLVLAAATPSEVRTLRCNPVKRWSQNFFELGAHESGAAFDDTGIHLLSRNYERKKHRLAAALGVSGQPR